MPTRLRLVQPSQKDAGGTEMNDLSCYHMMALNFISRLRRGCDPCLGVGVVKIIMFMVALGDMQQPLGMEIELLVGWIEFQTYA